MSKNKQHNSCKGCFWNKIDCRPDFREACKELYYKYYYSENPYLITRGVILSGLAISIFLAGYFTAKYFIF